MDIAFDKWTRVGKLLIVIAFYQAVSLVRAEEVCSALPNRPVIDADFCKADITTYVKADDGTLRLIEAYKVRNYSDPTVCGTPATTCVAWLSVGYPTVQPLVRRTDQVDQTEVTTFLFSQTGFSVRVQLLSASDKMALAKSASIKYGVTVLPSQFIEMPISRLTCRLRLYASDSAVGSTNGSNNGVYGNSNMYATFAGAPTGLGSTANMYTYFGSATGLLQSPYAVRFTLPPDGFTRQLAEQSLKVWNSPLLTERSSPIHEFDSLDCRILYAENQTVETRLQLLGADYGKLLQQLVGNGNGSTFYLTRTQFSLFALKLYEMFEVKDDFEVQLVDFQQSLFDELVERSVFSPVREINATTALERLSSFGWLPGCSAAATSNETDDAESSVASESSEATSEIDGGSNSLDAVAMLRDLMNVFTTSSRNQSARTNVAWLGQLVENEKLQSGLYCGVINLGSLFDDLTRLESNGSDIKSTGDIVRTLNGQPGLDVTWLTSRNRNILPRAIRTIQVNTAQLRRIKFLNRIKRVEYSAAFSRDFRLSFTKIGLSRYAYSDVPRSDSYALQDAVMVLNTNISGTLRQLEERFENLTKNSSSALVELRNLTGSVRDDLKTLQLSSVESIKDEVTGYKTALCLFGFSIANYSVNSPSHCASLCNESATCIGFNWYKGASSTGLCELKKAVAGTTYQRKARYSPGCKFYYRRCPIYPSTFHIAGKVYYTTAGEVQVPVSFSEASRTCLSIRQHLIETRTLEEQRAIPFGTVYWQNIQVSGSYSWYWLTDLSSDDGGYLGTLVSTGGNVYIATYYSPVYYRMEYYKVDISYRCYIMCQCTDYALW